MKTYRVQNRNLPMKLAFVIPLILGLNAFAQVFPQIGQPAYGGNGCPAGSASVILSSDSSGHLILLDKYSTESGTNGKRIDRKSCNIAIPIQVPSGYQLAVQPALSAFIDARQQGTVTIQIETFLAGTKSSAIKRQFKNTSSQYDLGNEFILGKAVWSACGQATNLRINTSVLSVGSSTITNIDPIGLKYYLRRCN